jgi:hypothetical protein
MDYKRKDGEFVPSFTHPELATIKAAMLENINTSDEQMLEIHLEFINSLAKLLTSENPEIDIISDAEIAALLLEFSENTTRALEAIRRTPSKEHAFENVEKANALFRRRHLGSKAVDLAQEINDKSSQLPFVLSQEPGTTSLSELPPAISPIEPETMAILNELTADEQFTTKNIILKWHNPEIDKLKDRQILLTETAVYWAWTPSDEEYTDSFGHLYGPDKSAVSDNQASEIIESGRFVFGGQELASAILEQVEFNRQQEFCSIDGGNDFRTATR